MLAAGMDGIERELSLPEPIEENLYHFSDDDLERRNVGPCRRHWARRWPR